MKVVLNDEAGIVQFFDKSTRYCNYPVPITCSLYIEQLIDEFDIDDDGIIHTHGKFEREHFSAYLFYQSAMESGADKQAGDSEGPGYYWLFYLEPGEHEEWYLPSNVTGVILRESSSGFIELTTYEYRDKLNSAWESVEAECSE